MVLHEQNDVFIFSNCTVCALHTFTLQCVPQCEVLPVLQPLLTASTYVGIPGVTEDAGPILDIPVWCRDSPVPPCLCWSGCSEALMLNLTHCEKEQPMALTRWIHVAYLREKTMTDIYQVEYWMSGEVLMWDHWRGPFHILIHNKECKHFLHQHSHFWWRYINRLVSVWGILYTVKPFCCQIVTLIILV